MKLKKELSVHNFLKNLELSADMLCCKEKQTGFSFYSHSFMRIELNHGKPASDIRVCVTDPNVILHTCCSTDLAHARGRTFRSAYNKMAVSDLLFHQCDICRVTLVRTDTQLHVFTGSPAQRERTIMTTLTPH